MKKNTKSAESGVMPLLTRVKHLSDGKPEWCSDALTKVWILRMIIYACSLGRMNMMLSSEIRVALVPMDCDLDVPMDGDFINEAQQNLFVERLREQLKREEAGLDALEEDTLSFNIACLAEKTSLSPVEQAVLYSLVKMQTNTSFKEAMEAVQLRSGKAAYKALSSILNLPARDIEKALHPNAPLARSGLVEINHRNYPNMDLSDVLEVPNEIAEQLLITHETKAGFLDSLLQHSPPSLLSRRDFHHTLKEYDLVLDYLKVAVRENSIGVNILIYGRPGTGKTEMARSLCAELRCRLYEVPIKNREEEPLSGAERISSCQLAQQLLSRNSDDVLLFDEIEDVFPNWGFLQMFRSEKDHKKAWINHLLENNVTPTIWISNAVSQIDPAFIRRFDVVLHLRHPDPKAHRRILKKTLSGLNISETWRRRTAERRNVTPAHVERAAKVTRALTQKRKTSKQFAETTLDMLIGNTLEAQGQLAAPRSFSSSMIAYDPAALNIDVDLKPLIRGLQKHRQGRLCFYGPPGTGKTAFARHLAQRTDSPILVKRLDEILNCFVGNTEKNIAAMFREAEAENAILLLDEADSLLRSRRTARQNWEITQVNQMLTCMERFDGVFIASTNLMDNLDEASLRRFDHKIRFNPLNAKQSLNMFLSLLKKQKLKLKQKEFEEISHRLGRISDLTLGDYNTALRKQRLLDTVFSPLQLLEALENECAVKSEHQCIGFLH